MWPGFDPSARGTMASCFDLGRVAKGPRSTWCKNPSSDPVDDVKPLPTIGGLKKFGGRVGRGGVGGRSEI